MKSQPLHARRRLGMWLGASVLACLGMACGPADSEVGNPKPACPTGSIGCVTTSGGGQGASGGDEGGTGHGNDVRGMVGVLGDPTFTTISPYGGAATIVTQTSSGTPSQVPYGDAKTSFDLADVMPGQTWFFVRDETVGATGILSTHSVVNVPTMSDVVLPVLDRNVLTSIMASLPSPTTLEDGRAQLVLLFVRGGQPMSGVSLQTALPGAVLAYDNGAGLYTNQATLTGPAGVTLVLNLSAPTTAELRNMTLTDVNGQAYMIQVPIQSNAATFAAFEL